MAYALVNSSNVENFDGSSVTQLETPAYSLTAGNLSIVVARTGAGTNVLQATSCRDTAGNRYVRNGAVGIGQGLGFIVWSAPNCKGHASNVVTVTHPSNPFTSVSALQFSGTAGVTFDRMIGTYVASGVSVSCEPSGKVGVPNQIAIIGSDVGNSRITTTIAPTSTFTRIYGSTGPVGNGSHDVWYNINSTRLFDGTVTVTATYDNENGNWANPKTIFGAIFNLGGNPDEAIFEAGGATGPLAWLELTLKTEPT